MATMKALVIAPQPFFSPRGTPMSVYYRALVMARKGVEIDLLTYGEGQDVNVPGVRIVRTPRFAFLGDVKIGPSLLKIFLDMFIMLRAIGLLIRHRYDFVHAHEEAAFMAIVLRPIFRFKLVYDMHSSLPEQLNNFGWSKSKVLRGLITSAEDRTLQRADALITICPALADYATSRIADTGKHFLIENSIFEPVNLTEKNESNGAAVDVSSVFDELKSSGATSIVVYAGTLETYQGIDLLLESMVFVKRENDSIRLIVIGGSSEQVTHYTAMAQNLGVNDVCVLFSRVPQATARTFAAKADVLVSPRTRGMNTPLKIYEQLDSGKPLVATRIPSHTQVLNEEVAFLADPQPGAFAEQIVLASGDVGLAAEKVRCARKHYEESYSPTVYSEKIDRLLDLID
jgi:glycosyltransferase involved in cell wall biosynthesis